MTHSPSADIPALVPAGDTALIWAEFAGRLRAFVARRVPPGIEPDDVVQEVFLRVMRHLPSLRDPGRLEGWLFQIARNTLLDVVRARRRREWRIEALEMDALPEPGTDDERAAEAELAPCLVPMVASLPGAYRQAIELTSVQGLGQSDAATHADVSISGMKSRVQRARARLKQMLLRCCEVGVNSRRGVTGYNLRDPASCGTPGGPTGDALSAVVRRAGSDILRPFTAHSVLWSRAAARVSPRQKEVDMAYTSPTQTTPAPDGASTNRTPGAPGTCCGGPAPAATDACCARDAEVKSAGGAGCGCRSVPAAAAPSRTGCCAGRLRRSSFR